jgi:glycosyltransferase involved in cell wall biosynthesis
MVVCHVGRRLDRARPARGAGRRVKILLATDVDVSLPGGVETHLRELARALLARGHAVALAARAPAVPGNMPVCPRTDAIDPAAYDVVHEHGVRILPALARATNVLKTIHFCTAAKMAAYVRIGRWRTLAHPLNWRAAWLERRACHTPWTRIAVSARVRDDCARWYGLESAATAVVPNGASFAPARTERRVWRERHGIPADAPLLLTIGRDDFVKGHGLLSAAWRAVNAAGRGAWWVTAGGRERQATPGRLVTGPVAHEDVREWIHAADLGALPSHYEGCSLAHLEMLAGGLWTLAHDVGICAEVTRAGENGALVAPDVSTWTAALARWLDAPDMHRGGGLDSAYAWDALAVRIEDVYERISRASARRDPQRTPA